MTYIVDDKIVTENDYTLGDVDGDGIIASNDADLVKQYNMGEITFTSKQFKAADMNEDGEIGPSDYVILCNKIAGMYQKGDVNTDGVVDTEDLQLVKDYLVGNIEFNSAQKQLADMNGDGEVTETDMAKLSMLVK